MEVYDDVTSNQTSFADCALSEREAPEPKSAKMAAPGESGGRAFAPSYKHGEACDNSYDNRDGNTTVSDYGTCSAEGIYVVEMCSLGGTQHLRNAKFARGINKFEIESLLKGFFPTLNRFVQERIPIKNASTVEHCTVTEETSADFVYLVEMNSMNCNSRQRQIAS